MLPLKRDGHYDRATMSDIASRKADHIQLCAEGDVGFRNGTTLFECVKLVHDSLPELALEQIDTHIELFGKRLSAPLFIAAMTGGTEEAAQINLGLAALAEEFQIGFGVGSQRPMQKSAATTSTYQVRDVAPTTVVLGNLGVVQAARTPTADVAALAAAIGADAMCIHLNPAMELVQPEGDRDFRGCLAALQRLGAELPVPVVAKETGSGLSRAVGKRLRDIGILHVDVSAAGGTSWVAVETHRARSEGKHAAAALGEALWDWGIPTAASVGMVAPLGFRTVIATGGIATGTEVAKAIALGASAAGIARPLLQAWKRGGATAAREALHAILAELRAVMLLVGAGNLQALRTAPRLIRGELADWLAAPH
jgi:isopentenyl-diphosphate Delta-isomerase